VPLGGCRRLFLQNNGQRITTQQLRKYSQFDWYRVWGLDTTVTMHELGLRPMLLHYHVGATVLGAAALFPAVEKEEQQFTVRCFDVAGKTHNARISLEIRGF
jgi:hypothetical protein